MFGVDSLNGLPTTLINQFMYSPLNTSWYAAIEKQKVSLIYGTTVEPQYNKEGIIYGIPLFNGSTFSGAVAVFAQTSVLSTLLVSITGSYANVSYIMDYNNYLLATSVSPELQSFVSSSGGRLSALNSTNAVIRASATYLAEQSVEATNTFFAPLGPNHVMEIALSTITTVESVELGWKVVSVGVFERILSYAPTSRPTVAPTISPTDTTSSSSNDSQSAVIRDVVTAAIVIGSVGVAAVAAFVFYRYYSYSSSGNPPIDRQSTVEIQATSNSPFSDSQDRP